MVNEFGNSKKGEVAQADNKIADIITSEFFILILQNLSFYRQKSATFLDFSI